MRGEVETHRDVVFAEGGHNPREPQCFEDAVDSPEHPMMGIYYDKIGIALEKPETVCRTTMVRTRDWKLVIRSSPEEKEELYHLREDPDELVNLIDKPEYRKKIGDLKELILYWLSGDER
jgi:choline-sulfatase